MASLMASLPLHLLCQLIGSGSPVTNTINITVSELQQQVQHTTTTIPDGYNTYPDINEAYKIYADKLTWTEAREQCTVLGARLAVIDSKKKADFVANQRSSNESSHIGIYRMDKTWVDISTDGDCARTRTLSPSGVWNGVCSEKRTYICEVSVPANFAQENQVAEITAH